MAMLSWPRLQLRGMSDLWRAHVALVQADELLQKTNWAGAPPCRVLIGNADSVVAELWNQCEAAVNRAGASPRGGMQHPSDPLKPSDLLVGDQLAPPQSK